MASAAQTMMTIDKFLQSVGAVKAAADPLSEPGSIGGETKHPVKKVDDRLQNVTEGERTAENEKDVKNDQGPASVENAAKAALAKLANQKKKAEGAVQTSGSAADDAEESVLNVQPTGEDPANETASAKGGKEDPGSSHPARTDNDSLDGHKYAFDDNTPIEKLASMFQALGEQLCAQIAWMSSPQAQGSSKQASSNTQQKSASTQPQPQPQNKQASSALAAQVGWELAGLLEGTMDKAAADRMVTETLESIVKQASEDADAVARYYSEFFAQQQKQAEGAGMPPAGAGMPPAGAGGGMSEEDMLALLGGAGGAGGAPEGGAPVPGAGTESEAEEAAELTRVLEELGVTPEELMAAMEQDGAGAGGPAPMPSGGGGMPGMEVAASDRNKQSEKSAAQMREYIAELIKRSRGTR